MRRLTRIRKPASFLTFPQPSSSVPCNARCFTAAHRNSFSTSRSRHLRPGAPRWQEKRPEEPRPETHTPTLEEPERSATDVAELAREPTEVDEVTDPVAEEQALVPVDATPNVILPPKIKPAPRQEEVTDPSYSPATTGEGLEEVGGLEGWFEKDEHWIGNNTFEPFSRRQKVMDAATLQVIARRAVVEALAVRDAAAAATASAGSGPTLVGLWRVGGRDAALRALESQIEVSADGEAKLAGGAEAAAGLVDNLSVSEEDGGAARDDATLDAAEAAEILASLDSSWKKISLQDLSFKFAVTKRIQQLSGHIIPDSKLSPVEDVRGLLAILIRPPKPTKLIDIIREIGDLEQLSNVTVHERRVTPIDKQKAVGRWKVIEQELERRDLPVTGTGKYGRSVERAWVRGLK